MHARTIRKKTTSAPSATLFRRRRRQARNQGLRPTIGWPCSFDASSAAVSRVNSLSVRWATAPPPEEECRGPRAPVPPTSISRPRLLVADGGEVEQIQHVVHV